MEHNVMGIDPCDSQNHAIFNATTQKHNIVDPRTGLFEVHVPLPSVTGNNGSGPVVDMSLFYTPVVNNSAALGDGWSLAFTTYNEKKQQLTLHSGEVLHIEKSKDLQQPAVEVNWDGTSLIVSRRDGRQEVLKQVDDTKIYVPETITTDGYNRLSLTWVSVPHTIGDTTHYQIQLTGIKDATRELLNVAYTSATDEATPVAASATITYWPNDESERLSFNLALEDHALKSVTAANGTQSTFEYQDHATCGWLLTTITTFEGLKEDVTYEDNGLKFDDNLKLSALPCVSTHTLIPLGSGTPVTTRYTYQRVDPKNYTTMVEKGANPTRTTTYHYDEHHEVVKEVSSQGSGEVITRYEAKQAVGRNRSVRTTFTKYQKDNKSREKAVMSQFDHDSVNAINNLQSGVLTDWYHSGGARDMYQMSEADQALAGLLMVREEKTEDEYIEYAKWEQLYKYHPLAAKLSDPVLFYGSIFPSKYIRAETVRRRDFNAEDSLNGLNRNLIFQKCKAVKEHALFKFHDYTKVNGMRDLKVAYTLQVVNAAQSIENAALIAQEISYFEDDDFRKGRQWTINQSSTDSRGEPISTEPERRFEYTLEGTELTTTTTETKDDTDRSTSQTHSILSGRLIRQVDEDGNRADFAYNECGQLVSHTTCAQSEAYKQTTTYDYPSPGRLEVTEPNGQKRVSEYDGQDNLIKEYVQDGSELRLVVEVSYDDLGRKLRTTRHDYLADGTQVSEWCEVKYDDWNEECSRLYSNGQEVFNQYDPVALTRTEWTGVATDLHGKVTTYNEDGTVNKVEWKDAGGNVYQTQTSTYTHAGQVAKLQTTKEFGDITIDYTYDGIGRLLSEHHVEKGADTTELTYTYRYTYPQHWLISEAEQIDIEFDGVTRTLGKRTFDSWGRVTSLTRGSSTETYTYNGASRLPATKNTPEGNTLSYEYIKELGNRLSKVSTADGTAQKTFTYAYGNVNTSTACEGERFLEFNHDLNARLSAQRAQTQQAIDKKVHSRYSLGGRLLSETDAQGNTTDYSYSSHGQRDKTVSGDLTTTHAYDSQGRLSKEVITQGYNSVEASVTVSYGYDSKHRETSRHFMMNNKIDLTLTRTYNADNSLKSIELKKGDEIMSSRTLAYTAGGRLASCKTTGVWQPKTRNNNDMESQVFTYDALGNVRTCVTRGYRTSTYTYDEASGCRLEKVEHSPEDSDHLASTTLSYDVAGRVIQDQTGKKYTYDWLGRQTQAGSIRYTYDAQDRLMTLEQEGEQRQIIYDGLQVRGEYHPENPDTTRHLCPGSAACTVQRVKRSGVDRILFELRDLEGTVLISYDVQAETMKHHAYSTYGEHSSKETDSLLGFNGEYRDANNDQYPLGQGFRWYAPASMQFHAQDTLSPFGEGGPHAYGYCYGNPANFQDRSGHVGSGAVQRGLRSIWGDSLPGPLSMGRGKSGVLISTILWSGIGILTAVMTGGTSLLVTAALVGLAIAASATAITAVVIADSNPELAAILGWVSLGLTLAGGVAMLATKVVQLAVRLARSGIALAKNVYHKAAVAVARLRLGEKPFKARKTVYRPTSSDAYRGMNEIDNTINNIIEDTIYPTEMFYFDTKPLVKEGAMTRLFNETLGIFDIGDANTVVCAVTGVLGNAGYFESDRAAFINGNINNATWLPWGHFNIGRP
jgi:RHS repeat-associated protein